MTNDQNPKSDDPHLKFLLHPYTLTPSDPCVIKSDQKVNFLLKAPRSRDNCLETLASTRVKL